MNNSKKVTENLLIFTHIPKTGGVTLTNLIERQFKSNEILLWFKPDIYLMDDENKICFQSPEKIKLIHGHIPFGIHNYLSVPATYITFLREPIKRTISDYNFWRKKHLREINEHELSLNLKDFCEKTGDNLMTRFISGLDFLSIWKLNDFTNFRLKRVIENANVPDYYQQCPLEMLEIAKKNLKTHFRFIGITERFDESLLLLKRNLDWKNIYYFKKNVASRKTTKKIISDSTFKCIEEYNKLDIELYRYALDLFEEQISQAGGLFEEELKTFQFFNPICSFPEYINTKITWKIKNIQQKSLFASNSKTQM